VKAKQKYNDINPDGIGVNSITTELFIYVNGLVASACTADYVAAVLGV